MNPWYFAIGIFFISFLLIVGIIICAILLMIQKARKNINKAVVVSAGINFLLLVATVLYVSSHSTYYKYNDWAILGSNIYTIEQKYGEFDLGKITAGQKGQVAYYIYTDNGPIMPDHLDHYYYIAYDEQGVVYCVWESLQPGG
ncbi:MAG: hypothetical protein IJP31_08475 [Lachnospiraceae bacterium]|nr:hypothetical protein [Lachnospiraceae bacterium]